MLKPALHYKIPKNIYKKIKIVTKSIMSIQSLTGSRSFCNIICLRNAWRSPNVCVGLERENLTSIVKNNGSRKLVFYLLWLDKFVQQEIKQRHSHSLCETEGFHQARHGIPVAIHDVHKGRIQDFFLGGVHSSHSNGFCGIKLQI